jgi:hypothetical protein
MTGDTPFSSALFLLRVSDFVAFKCESCSNSVSAVMVALNATEFRRSRSTASCQTKHSTSDLHWQPVS